MFYFSSWRIQINRDGITARNYHVSILLLLLIAITASVDAQQKNKDTLTNHEIALRLRNPVTDLINVPLQDNLEFGVGDSGLLRNTLEIEPVIPIVLSKTLRLVTRTIIPFEYQQGTASKGSAFGLGDIVLNVVLGPNYRKGGWVYGIGAEVNLPTTVDPRFGFGEWAAGPNAVFVKQSGNLNLGLLLDQIWSFNPQNPNKVSQGEFDLWANYSWENGLSADMEIDATDNWYTDQWTIPFRFGIGKVFNFGKLPLAFNLDGLYYVQRVQDDPKWGISPTVTVVF